MWPLAVNAQPREGGEKSVFSSETAHTSSSSSSLPPCRPSIPFNADRNNGAAACHAVGQNCEEGSYALLKPAVPDFKPFPTDGSEHRVMLPVLSHPSLHSKGSENRSLWKNSVVRVRCFYFSSFCQKTLACISGLTLLFLSFLILVDISSRFTAFFFSSRDTADRFMIYVDIVFTLTLLFEIMLRCIVWRSRLTAGRRASLMWALCFDTFVFVASVASVAAVTCIPLSSTSRETTLGINFAFRIVRDAVRLALILYVVREMDITPIDFVPLLSQASQSSEKQMLPAKVQSPRTIPVYDMCHLAAFHNGREFPRQRPDLTTSYYVSCPDEDFTRRVGLETSCTRQRNGPIHAIQNRWVHHEDGYAVRATQEPYESQIKFDAALWRGTHHE